MRNFYARFSDKDLAKWSRLFCQDERRLCKCRADSLYSVMPPATYLTVNETAEILRCTTDYVRRLIKTGRLRKFQPAKKMVRLRLGDVARFMGETNCEQIQN